jgi:hypothetical protein
MRKLLLVSIALFSLAVSAQALSTASVDCTEGESLNNTLARLHKEGPLTVSVSGTCAEYVHVTGVENLTLIGLPGAFCAVSRSISHRFTEIRIQGVTCGIYEIASIL